MTRNGGTTVMVNCRIAFWAVGVWLSVTRAVNVKIPLAVGVPLRTPVLGFNVTPPGRAPD
jgi:hypothetical protein